MPLTKRALIIGGGIAGIQAALDLANAQIPVSLVEREPSLGGNMARLSETFPTLDCSQCILTPSERRVGRAIAKPTTQPTSHVLSNVNCVRILDNPYKPMPVI